MFFVFLVTFAFDWLIPLRRRLWGNIARWSHAPPQPVHGCCIERVIHWVETEKTQKTWEKHGENHVTRGSRNRKSFCMKQNGTNNPHIQIQMGQTIQIQSKYNPNISPTPGCHMMSWGFQEFPGWFRGSGRRDSLTLAPQWNMMKYDGIQ